MTALACGAVAYAVFEGCDPVKSGEVTKTDQIMPYLVLKTSMAIPGVAGLFVASVYSGTLRCVYDCTREVLIPCILYVYAFSK